MVLAAPRKIASTQVGLAAYGVAAAVVCIQSGLAVLDGGFLRPGRTGQGGTDALKAADAAGYKAVGVFVESATGGVADGDVTVQVQAGCFNFANSAGADEITIADVGKVAFIVDDETLARTSAGGTRAIAGPIIDVDEDGVWAEVGPVSSAAAGGSVILPFFINQTDLLAGTAAELVSPVAGAIARVTSIVQVAVTIGGPITAAVGVTAVDGLSVVIADGAVKGSVVSDTPTAGHATTLVSPGDRIQVIPDAAFATAGAVSGFVEISY
ncbi:MAG: hypothetical protein GC145_18605 [Caulobacter sp.]|nr:hypothetical protein [Caulobacter sp.]